MNPFVEFQTNHHKSSNDPQTGSKIKMEELLLLRRELYSRKNLLSDKELLEKLPDKGERIIKKIQSLEQKIKILENELHHEKQPNSQCNLQSGEKSNTQCDLQCNLQSNQIQQSLVDHHNTQIQDLSPCKESIKSSTRKEYQKLSNCMQKSYQYDVKQSTDDINGKIKQAQDSIDNLTKILQQLRFAEKKKHEQVKDASIPNPNADHNFLRRSAPEIKAPTSFKPNEKYNQLSELLLKGKKGIEWEKKSKKVVSTVMISIDESIEHENKYLEQELLRKIEMKKRELLALEEVSSQLKDEIDADEYYNEDFSGNNEDDNEDDD